MSRSYRHTPVCGVCCCDSEKYEKRLHNRRMRVRIRRILHTFDPDTVFLPLPDEVSCVWNWGKDGKMRFDPDNDEWGRKLMRK